MLTRYALCEQILRQIYGEEPADDSNITINLVNQYLSQAIGFAARKNYTDNVQIENISFVNNSFYTTYRGLNIANSQQFTYKISLPEVPVGIGRNEGIASLKITNGSQISLDCIPLSINQVGYADSMRPIPAKILYWNEGSTIYLKSITSLLDYNANIRMVSGGDSTDINSEVNVPPDYIPVITEFIGKALMLERNQPKELANDGVDIV